MARLSDFPLVVRRIGFLTFVRRIWREIQDDHLFTWGAALAYAWLFAIFPFLLFLLTLVPHVLPAEHTKDAYYQVEMGLYEVFGETYATNIWQNVKPVLDGPPRGLWSVGLLVTIWAASGGINMTMTALDRCYEIERGRSFFGRRLVAIGITLVVATMIIAVLLLIPVGNLVTHYAVDNWPKSWGEVPRYMLWAWNAARYALAGVLMFGVVSIMYYFGISVRQRWRVLSPGSVFTIAVWVLLAVAFRWYIEAFGKESYRRTYGVVGAAIVLLLFFYLDALVLMIGAEINSEIDYEVTGSERGCRDFTVVVQPMFVDQSVPGGASAGAARREDAGT